MNLQKATLAGGCFWCTEAIYQHLKGVTSVKSGYTGGTVENPSYMEISNGNTGHAEAIELEFDADVISYNQLLLIFFKTHNATTLNSQGNDIGTQYRSAIFYHDDEQKQQAEAMIRKLDEDKVFDKPIVTHIVPAGVFYKAEDYHQNYFNANTMKPYCAFVIQPKITKLWREFTDKIKPGLL